MNPHTHITALNGVIVALYVVVVIGTINVVARRYEGHPFADAWLSIWA